MKRLFTGILALTLTLTGCTAKPTEHTAEGPTTNPSVVQLTPEAVQQTGIEVLTAQEKELSKELTVTGDIRVDENRLFKIGSPVAGRLMDDRVILGDRVKAGQRLASVQNVEVARVNGEFIHQLHQNEIDLAQAKTRLALAQKNLAREKKLLDEGISPRKDFYQAEADATLAVSEVRGLQEHAVHIKSEAQAILGAYGSGLSHSHSETVQSTSGITAPRNGVVLKKNVTLGSMVSPADTLYEVADLSRVWLDMTVYPKDVERLKLGQKVVFVSDALVDQTFVGTIQYLQPALQDINQTFVARVFLDNPKGVLRPGMLGQATITTDGGQPQVFLPEVAVQSDGEKKFVFLVKGTGKYQKQPVTISNKNKAGYYIQSGVKPGDTVVGQGAFTLKAELLKSQFAEEE